MWKRLAKDPNAGVSKQLAADQSVAGTALERLAEDPNTDIRYEAATPPKLLKQLPNDPTTRVSKTVSLALTSEP